MTAPQDPFVPPGDQPAAGGAGPQWGPPPGQQSGGQQSGGQQSGGQQSGAQQSGGQQSGAQPYAGQPWGTAPHAAGPGGPQRNGVGVAAFVVGVLALLSCFTIVGGIVLGLVAIVLGALGRGRARRGEAGNGGTAVAGLVLGALGLVLAVVFLVLGVALFQSDSGRGLIDCLEQAGDDQAAVEACQRELVDDLEN